MRLASLVVGLLAVASPLAGTAIAAGDPSLDALIRSGMAHKQRREWGAALRDYSEALALALRTGRLDNERWLRESLVEARGELASEQLARGDFRAARSGYREVLGWAAELGQPGNAAIASYQSATLHRLLGELDEARAVLLGILQQEPPPLPPADMVAVWNELGLVNGDAGRLDERIRCHQAALELTEESGSRVAETLEQLVDVHTQLGDYPTAIAIQAKALDAAIAAGDERIAAHGRANRAYLHLLTGDPERALAAATEALPEIERVSDDEGLLSTLDTIARAALALRELDAGEEALAQAECVIQRFERASLTPDERSRWRARQHFWELDAQDLLAARLHAEEDPARRTALAVEGLRRAEFWKAAALIEMLDRRIPAREPFDIDSLRAGLAPNGRVLIEFASGWDELYAYVLTDRGIEHVRLGPRAPIEEEVAHYVRDLHVPGSRAAIARRGQELYRVLLEPLRIGRDVTDLVVVPTPALAALPFEALVIDAPAPSPPAPSLAELTFVLDRYVVRYGASAQALLRQERRPRRGLLDHVLIVADPTYADEGTLEGSDGRTPTGTAPARLAESRQEALEFADGLLARHPATSDRNLAALGRLRVQRSFAFTEHPALDLYVGADAGPEVFERDLGDVTLIHVAAHAFADEEHPENSRIALAGEDAAGELSIARIESLELGTELVVLSACETAGGAVRNGEGALSLARAFGSAGARSVVASLWIVYDDKTRATMQTFTRLVVAGVEPAVALREAKLALRRTSGTRSLGTPVDRAPDLESAHPCFWAPFVHLGP